ncbi:fumarylacetoacetate hydrolase family protein [Streptomyces sp. NPDC007205]|uniref:fumarylacetoacetate hydrolase family protein n=1 Tax=Streptomyces sp. NPDC007205 TaxID=3154316 RepID=UPI0033DC2646
MHLVTYRPPHTGDPTLTLAGVLHGGYLVNLNTLPLPSAYLRPDRAFRSVEDVLSAHALDTIQEAWNDVLADRGTLDRCLVEHGVPAGDVHFEPPVLRPGKVIGVGMNYRSFLAQLNEPVPEHPTVFHKTASALRGHCQAVHVPSNTSQPVPEGELAVIIGERAHQVSPAEALSHVAGYSCANDISARDLEFRTSQWTSGKMLATFGPLGPALVTPDEIVDVTDLAVRTYLNGDVIQDGNTADMTFGVAEIISRLSWLTPLEVGDVVLTGTPSDLGELSPPVFLTAGDTIEVEVEGIGRLTNTVVAPHLTPRA